MMPTSISEWVVLIILLLNTYLTWLAKRNSDGRS